MEKSTVLHVFSDFFNIPTVVPAILPLQGEAIPAAWERETKTQISRKTRHTQPLKLNMACIFVDQP